jgi:hypothetical protein
LALTQSSLFETTYRRNSLERSGATNRSAD